MQKMTRIAALSLVAVAALLLLVAIVIAIRTPSRSQAPVAANAAPQATTRVVVAARDLAAGHAISGDDLQLADATVAPTGSYTDLTQLSGALTAAPVKAGTPLTAVLLARGIALRLQPGERALAVPVDELSAAGNRIAPGDYVDVFLSLDAQRGIADSASDSQARLLLPRLRVLGYGGADLDPAPVPATTQTSTGDATGNSRAASISGQSDADSASRSATPARSAVLAVPVESASRLLLAAQRGKLFLALRHPGDEGRPDEALFPAPSTVLNPRVGLDPGQREALATPDNAAFAGIDGDALAGRTRATPSSAVATPAPRRRTSTSPPLQIIRGSQTSQLSP